MDRFQSLAKNIVHYSCSVQKGEKVLIDEQNVDERFLCCLVDEIYAVGAFPFVYSERQRLKRCLMHGMTKEKAMMDAKFMLPVMKEMDAYIGISGCDNLFELASVSAEKKEIRNTFFNVPVHFEERVKNTKWCLLIWPTDAYAQSANMSLEEFEELFFKVCCMDYKVLSEQMQVVKKKLESTSIVQILGNDTDLTFSIKGQPAIVCDGKNNIPDGEVFTAPLRESVNGKIRFNIPTIYQGERFDNIFLEVEDGKIVNATCNGDCEKLNKILDTDEGARYFGEFALGMNPHIKKPMLDILFDEKMSCSFHLTPGCCYDEAPNGNISAVHWDMVFSVADGNGKVLFDGEEYKWW